MRIVRANVHTRLQRRIHWIAAFLLVHPGCAGSSAGPADVDASVDAALADAPALDAAVVDAVLPDATMDALAPDSDAAPGLMEFCLATRVLWWNEVEDLDRSCSAASDCWPIGFVQRSDGLPTCGCAYSVSGSHGMQAVRSNPYSNTHARDLERVFFALCAERNDLPLGYTRCEEGWPDVSCVEERCQARPSTACRPW